MNHPIYLAPGLLVAAAGFCLLFGLLASEGALGKSRQLAATGDLASGRAGRTKKRLFFVAIAALGLGTCGTFAGVAANDSKRAKACEKTCAERGYAKGHIRGSEKKDANARGRSAFVACACEGGPAPDPLELRADTLEE
ncbi:MAG: hypothetical protein HOW73_12485 [Polyangiaceae bacterium]|nr:hypothetical protein [Polyangiaceae bacterium]